MVHTHRFGVNPANFRGSTDDDARNRRQGTGLADNTPFESWAVVDLVYNDYLKVHVKDSTEYLLVAKPEDLRVPAVLSREYAINDKVFIFRPQNGTGVAAAPEWMDHNLEARYRTGYASTTTMAFTLPQLTTLLSVAVPSSCTMAFTLPSLSTSISIAQTPNYAVIFPDGNFSLDGSGFTSQSGGTSNLWNTIDEAQASSDDATTEIKTPADTPCTGEVTLQNMPSDFRVLVGIGILVRGKNPGLCGDCDYLIVNSAGVTLTEVQRPVIGSGWTSAPEKRYADMHRVSLTGGDKTAMDGARLNINFGGTGDKADDYQISATELRVYYIP